MKKLALNTAVCGLLYANAALATDLEIYSSGSDDKGKTVLTMMLDKSGSMAYTVENMPHAEQCDVSKSTVFSEPLTHSFTINGAAQNVTVNARYKKCNRTDTKKYYTRMGALKKALFQAFTSDSLKDEYVVGLGAYPVSRSHNDIHKGQILVPAKKLDAAQRKALLEAVENMRADGGTPIANALAEAGAYMMGTNAKTGTGTKEVTKYAQIGYETPKVEASTKTVRYTRQTCSSAGGSWRYRWTWSGGYYYCNINGQRKTHYTVTTNAAPAKLYKCDSASSPSSKDGNDWYYGCAGTATQVDSNDNQDALDRSKIGYQDNDDYTKVGDKYYRVLKDTVQVSTGTEYSGFSFSAGATKTTNGEKYNMPEKSSGECGGGSGIYFMTDGVPNVAFPMDSNYNYDTDTFLPPMLMNSALSGSSLSVTSSSNECTGSGLLSTTGSSKEDGWTCISAFAKKLRDKSNPRKESIKTAAVGFGPQFKKMIGSKKIDKGVKDEKGNVVKVYDCTLLSSNERNLCELGEKGYGYGEGGAYFVNDGDGIVKSISDFASKLAVSTKVKPISTGNFSVPFDPFGSKTKFDSYLPMLNPSIGKNTLWVGNVKKYSIKDGAMVGKNGNNVLDVLKSDGSFNENTKDFWNHSTEASDGGDSQKGGVLSNIFNPADNKDRNLWVNTAGKLVKLSVDDSKKPQGFDALASDAAYTNKLKRQLINFLGYPVPVNNDALADAGGKIKDKALNEGFDANHKTHGAVLHSRPQLITKKVAYENGEVKESSREDYMLYGSFDGSLRVVDDKTGKEVFTFVPRHIAKQQGEYLVPKNTDAPSALKYGVDATWNVYADYESGASTSGSGASATTTVTLKAKNVIAAGGLRMGGSEYYALNLSDFTSPKLIYARGADDSDYSNMGQSWGTPTVGYVKTGESGTGANKTIHKTMVHFLPGGYDMDYESTGAISGTKKGNAVYMVKVGRVDGDIETSGGVTKDKGIKINYTGAGNRMWWASANAANVNSGSKQETKVADMTSSVVGSVIPLDRDYDGLTDHIYYADLGGKVYRADIDNTGASFKVTRVVKVLDVSNQKATSGSDLSAPRFYEAPLVTFMRWKYGADKGKIVAMVSAISGNRSKPLANRDKTKPDRLYTFLDTDVASNDVNFFDDTKFTKTTENLTLSDLAELKFSGSGSSVTESGSPTVKTQMTQSTNAKKGWYFDLLHWNNNYGTDVLGLKGINDMHALDSFLFFTVFNPNKATSAANSCSASIKGETQRDVLCLPFGSCYRDDNPRAKIKNTFLEKYEAMNAGKGLVSNPVGLLNKEGEKAGGIGIIKNTNDCDNKTNPYCESYGNKDFLDPREWKER